jgi:enoyl-CoA hydratase/carnithine racemase
VFTRGRKHNCLNLELLTAFIESLALVRADKALKVVITKGGGPSFSSGMDLAYLSLLERDAETAVVDWDLSHPNIRLTEMIRNFPRIMIAQVHGYCFGAALALMNAHDLVFTAHSAQIGMPELMRGSFGQIATATLFHAQIPIKKAAYIQLIGRNVSGVEADRLGLASLSFPDDELEEQTTALAREVASRHSVPLEAAKIAVQMGRDMSIGDAIKLDQLVGARQRLSINPTSEVDNYLKSQKGGPNVGYNRTDTDAG